MTNHIQSSLDSNIYWNSKLEHVAARCQRNLARYPSIDPDDATQEAMIQLLRVDFLKSYSPERGTIIAFTNGMIDNVCRKSVHRWYQRMTNQSQIDLAVLISKSINPEESAILHEIYNDIKSVRQFLPPVELRALPQVLERASGSRSVCKSEPNPNYSAESRCRSRLRALISHHNPHSESATSGKEKRTPNHHRKRLLGPKNTRPN